MNNEGKYRDCFHAELCQCLWHACPSNLFAAPISSCLEFDFESPWWVDQAAPCPKHYFSCVKNILLGSMFINKLILRGDGAPRLSSCGRAS